MNLREIRIKRNYTQQYVADCLQCSAVVYSRYETGVREPSVDTLCRLADIFGVTVDYLLERKQVDASELSSFETSLVIAARNADERARKDAMVILESHGNK